MSFSRWQTESDTRIAKVVVSLPASVAVYRAASVFWLKIGPLAGGANHYAGVAAMDLCARLNSDPRRQKSAAIAVLTVDA